MKLAEAQKYVKAGEFAEDMSRGLSDAHYMVALNSIKNKELDKAELADLSRDFAENENWDRTAASAEFVLNRMHILIHGAAPDGETERRAETMFSIPQKMIKFAEKQGYDTFENIKKARVDLKGRPVRRKEAEAKKLMSDYYMANKANLPKDIAKHRKAIISDLMAGLSPEEAFGRYS